LEAEEVSLEELLKAFTLSEILHWNQLAINKFLHLADFYHLL